MILVHWQFLWVKISSFKCRVAGEVLQQVIAREVVPEAMLRTRLMLRSSFRLEEDVVRCESFYFILYIMSL